MFWSALRTFTEIVLVTDVFPAAMVTLTGLTGKTTVSCTGLPHAFNKTDRTLLLTLETTMSGRPSPLTSRPTTNDGWSPTGSSAGDSNPPAPSFNRTVTVLAPALATT